MKYIDADKLKVEIERRKKICEGLFERESDTYYQGKAVAYGKLLSFIESLQQEQPDCHTVEEWMQHIKNSDPLTKDIFSKGPYDVLYDALNYPYQYCYDAIKEFGELCFQTGVNSAKQEQPEVDLDKLINDFLLNNSEFLIESDSKTVVQKLAHHFYELGKLNARKKE